MIYIIYIIYRVIYIIYIIYQSNLTFRPKPRKKIWTPLPPVINSARSLFQFAANQVVIHWENLPRDHGESLDDLTEVVPGTSDGLSPTVGLRSIRI